MSIFYFHKNISFMRALIILWLYMIMASKTSSQKIHSMPESILKVSPTHKNSTIVLQKITGIMLGRLLLKNRYSQKLRHLRASWTSGSLEEHWELCLVITLMFQWQLLFCQDQSFLHTIVMIRLEKITCTARLLITFIASLQP